MFFFLAQTEQGDIFKITLDTDEDMVSPEWFQVLKKYNDDLSEAHDLFTHTKKQVYTCFVCTKVRIYMLCVHTQKHMVFFYTEVRIHMLCLHKNEYKHAIG
jgi:hypothetical protein